MTADPPPLFVVGMPRSGTKLLRDLLNRHPSIAIPDVETEFLPVLARRTATCGDLSRLDVFRRFCRPLMRSSFFEYRREQGRPIDVQAWHRMCRTFDAAGVFEALIRIDTGAVYGSGRIWGDKSPSYIDDIELLAGLYPAARVLHIVRDVRDHCVSIHEAWGKDRLRAAQRWTDGVLAARRAGQPLGARYMELRYEDLLRDPEARLRQVCTFVGLEFVPRMTTLERPSENLGRASGSIRVESGNLGRFVKQMSPALCARIEAVAGAAMREFGYELSQPAQALRRLSRARLLLGQLLDAWYLTMSRRREVGLFGALAFRWRHYRTTRG